MIVCQQQYQQQQQPFNPSASMYPSQSMFTPFYGMPSTSAAEQQILHLRAALAAFGGGDSTNNGGIGGGGGGGTIDLSRSSSTNSSSAKRSLVGECNGSDGGIAMKRQRSTPSTESAADPTAMLPTTMAATFQRLYKDEPVPAGYLKFRFNEDCQFDNCGYRNHQSHFHCIRSDCHYSFCDKTRFVQHTARHERLDKLMGDDFRQYRANMQCGHDYCVYNRNMGEC